ncbi:hypothetical protein FACS1894171_1180 [Clostridia bacterium]|nr:hypothetical protein FACS1894171_1180 [Clostridia bacterium]
MLFVYTHCPVPYHESVSFPPFVSIKPFVPSGFPSEAEKKDLAAAAPTIYDFAKGSLYKWKNDSRGPDGFLTGTAHTDSRKHELIGGWWNGLLSVASEEGDAPTTFVKVAVDYPDEEKYPGLDPEDNLVFIIYTVGIYDEDEGYRQLFGENPPVVVGAVFSNNTDATRSVTVKLRDYEDSPLKLRFWEEDGIQRGFGFIFHSYGEDKDYEAYYTGVLALTREVG